MLRRGDYNQYQKQKNDTGIVEYSRSKIFERKKLNMGDMEDGEKKINLSFREGGNRSQGHGIRREFEKR